MTSVLTTGQSVAYLLETGLAPPAQRDRERYRRWMRANGLAPDEWASTMGYDDVERAMSDWRMAVDAQRVRNERDDWGEEPEPEEDEVTELLTIAQIAQLGNLSPTSIKTYRNRGTLPPPDSRQGNQPLWKRETVEEWLRTRPGRGRPRKV